MQGNVPTANCFVVGTIYLFERESVFHHAIIPKKTDLVVRIHPKDIRNKYLSSHNCALTCKLETEGKIKHEQSEEILLHIHTNEHLNYAWKQ